jgi:transposase
MENAFFHKKQDMTKALAFRGHTLEYFPTYLPDLDPIEKNWAAVKALLRRLHCPVERFFQKTENLVSL